MFRRVICWIFLLPFFVILALGAVLVAVSLFAIYEIADIASPTGAEWSA